MSLLAYYLLSLAFLEENFWQARETVRDRASTNNVAMRTMKVVYPHLLDIGCYSHTIDHVGEKFDTPNLDEFGKAWVGIFAHSPKARLLWRERTGRSMATYRETRWW